MKTFKQYFNEQADPDEDLLMQLMSLWAVTNKKYRAWYNLYKKHIDDWFDSIDHFKANGGKTYGQKWHEIVSTHIHNEDWFYQRKKVAALWKATQKKFKITWADLEDVGHRFGRL